MRRFQFIELHEQPWFPTTLRNEVTDALQFGSEKLKAYDPIFHLLQRALSVARSRSVVDLCSGSGGPWVGFSKRLGADSTSYRILLTDKFPNFAAAERTEPSSPNPVEYYRSPVDATHVPADLAGFRTVFTSFHHFPPAQARAILQDAVDARQGIGIFEVTRRRASAMAMIFVWFLTPLAFTPFIRPFRWSRLLYTYALPLIPLVLLFDGIVSCLRTYQPGELHEMAQDLAGPEYRWEVGEQTSAAGPPITYLIGYPSEPSITQPSY